MKKFLLLFALVAIAAAQTPNILVTWSTMTATGTTSSQYVPYGITHHTVQVVTTGSPTTCTVELDGSLDGSHWSNLSGLQDCTTVTMFHVADRAVNYVRGNLTALAGGTSPSVTLSYEGAQ